MHSAPTLCPACAYIAHALRLVTGLARSYCGPVSPFTRARFCAPYHRLLVHVACLSCLLQCSCAMSQGIGCRIVALVALYRDPESLPSATIQNFVSRPSASQAARCIATQKATPQPRYKFVLRLPLERPCARELPYARPVGQPYRGPTTLCRGRGLAISWPCPGCAQAQSP